MTTVPLRSIRAPENFNVRGVLPEIPKLADDIAERGQLEAIQVRRMQFDRISGAGFGFVDSYTVVFGFRRHAALCLLRDQKRSALVRYEHVAGSMQRGVHLQVVTDEFPVKVDVVEMSDRDALLANLAENAHHEGTREVDLYARVDQLLKDGVEREKLAQAAGISVQTLNSRISAFRRLSPEIVKLWRQIERPEHEPAWHFLRDVARGSTKPGKRGGDPASRLIPAPAHLQLDVWRKLYGIDGERSSVVRLAEPKWRERNHLRSIIEVRKKLAELQQRGLDEQNHGAIGALRWVLNEGDL